MFEFKILQTADRTQNGTYEHSGDELVFGSQEGEMVIDDPQLGASQLRLFFEGELAYIENLFPDCPVKLNQAPIGPGPHSVKPRDTIAMGKTVINLQKLQPGGLEAPTLDESQKPKTEQDFNPGSGELAIFIALQSLSKDQPGSSPPDRSTQDSGAATPTRITSPPLPNTRPLPSPPPLGKR